MEFSLIDVFYKEGSYLRCVCAYSCPIFPPQAIIIAFDSHGLLCDRSSILASSRPVAGRASRKLVPLDLAELANLISPVSSYRPALLLRSYFDQALPE